MTDDYRTLSVAAKQALLVELAHEPAIRCPWCEVGIMPSDLPNHLVGRCPGRVEPPRTARWLDWRQARTHASAGSLNRLVASGIVRIRGPVRQREYLERDLTLAVAWIALLKGRSLPRGRAR